MIALKEKQFKE
jgi:hypothetical protein